MKNRTRWNYFDSLYMVYIVKYMVYIVKRFLSWAGHVARMEFSRVPQKMLSSWVCNKRNVGCPEFTYGRGLFELAGLSKGTWFEIAQDHIVWSHLIKNLRI